jgi:hypothetical protein
MVMIITGRKEDITQGFWLCYFCWWRCSWTRCS